jgi:4-hydroxybutyrate CoA-transferase
MTRNNARLPVGPRQLTDFEEIARHLPPGSSVVLHSAYAEPKFLSQELARVGKSLQGVHLYTLMPMGGAPYAAPELDGHFLLRTFYPGKALRAAVNESRAQIIRAPLSALPRLFNEKSLEADVLLLQLSPADENGRMSLGVSVDYMAAVLAQKPLVVAEVNPAMPHTCGDSSLHVDQVDYVVDARTPPQSLTAIAADRVDALIAGHIAGLIDSGAVLQVGIGSISDLVLGQLTHLRDLGIHSGIITDAIVPLIERGIVTNASKRNFAGKTVATMAAGTQAFYDFLHRNPLIEMHPCSLTHDAQVLAGIDGLCAINTVLQIDLAGRANAEQIDGRIISSVGGLADFAQGAVAAKGGRSIIALRASSRDGRQSNILPRLPDGAPIALTAADIDFVVTEHGVASVRGLSADSLALALIGVAHPDHRAELRRSIRQSP